MAASESGGTRLGDSLVLFAADADRTDHLAVSGERQPPAQIITSPWYALSQYPSKGLSRRRRV